MRPKFISLLAVCAFALVGCASEAPSSEPTATVIATSTPVAATPTAPESELGNEVELAEKNFVELADVRAMSHSATITRTPKQIIKSLHAYCDTGKSIKVSENADLNENLEILAERSYCDNLK